MYEALAWAVAAVAFFSYLAVTAWVGTRQKEREAYYRAEAIKKVAEMQGNAPEPVLALLKEALSHPPVPPSPWSASPGVQKEFYKGELMKKIADAPPEKAAALLQLMREEQKASESRIRAGLRLAGMIAGGVGIALIIFLRAILPDEPVYLCGLIPLMVGVAMLAYSYLHAGNSGVQTS